MCFLYLLGIFFLMIVYVVTSLAIPIPIESINSKWIWKRIGYMHVYIRTARSARSHEHQRSSIPLVSSPLADSSLGLVQAIHPQRTTGERRDVTLHGVWIGLTGQVRVLLPALHFRRQSVRVM